MSASAQSSNIPSSPSAPTRQKVIIDTDIGDDIDDVLAVGLALNSPELEVIGITSAWGDTKLRARLLDRLLRETDHSDIPVAVDIERHKEKEAAFSQADWALREPTKPHHHDVVLRDWRVAQQRGFVSRAVANAPLNASPVVSTASTEYAFVWNRTLRCFNVT